MKKFFSSTGSILLIGTVDIGLEPQTGQGESESFWAKYSSICSNVWLVIKTQILLVQKDKQTYLIVNECHRLYGHKMSIVVYYLGLQHHGCLWSIYHSKYKAGFDQILGSLLFLDFVGGQTK